MHVLVPFIDDSWQVLPHLRAVCYGLDDRGLIPDRSSDYFLRHCLQTGSGAQPASYRMGTDGIATGA
jgi:hypothetical protein